MKIKIVIIIKIFIKIIKSIKKFVKNSKSFYFVNKFYKNKFCLKGKKNFFFFFKKKFLKIIKKNYVNIFLLENVGNITSCVRTCYLFNIYTIINFKYLKQNFFYNNIIFIKKNKKIINFLKKKNVIISLTLKSKINIKSIFLKFNFMIVIGNEKFSINKELLFNSDLLLKIKTYRKKSLNVNVVNGIILFNFLL